MPSRKPKAQEKDFQTVANEHGRNAVLNIKDDLDALTHAQACTLGADCKRGSETKRVRSKGKTYTQQIHNNPEAWHDEDAARRYIEESPLSLEVRGDWHTPGDNEGSKPVEYTILLGTGGPAARIFGQLSEHGEPETAEYQFQDWFKPWTPAQLTQEEEAVLLQFAQHFFFGE